MKTIIIFCCLLSCQVLAADLQKGEAKSMMCAACHGANGISTNPEWPHIAGQHVAYLIKQLNDFKTGKTRNSPMMTPMVAALTDEDMADLAAFYASKPKPQAQTIASQYKTRGEELYRRGDISKKITACITCHGPHATGNEQAGFPVLSGQQPTYTIQQLQAFKNQHRTNDINGIMRMISARMNDEDMKAVANYIAGLE